VEATLDEIAARAKELFGASAIVRLRRTENPAHWELAVLSDDTKVEASYIGEFHEARCQVWLDLCQRATAQEEPPRQRARTASPRKKARKRRFSKGDGGGVAEPTQG